MRFVLAIACALLLIFRPPMVDLGAVPLSQIHLNDGVANLWTGALWTGASGFALFSLFKDQFWPWHHSKKR